MRSCKSENIGIPPLKSDNSSISVTDKDKAESLNSYFHSVFTQEQLLNANIGTSYSPSIPDLKISADSVYKQLSQLNPKKACGPDEIPAKVFKEASLSISHWLSLTSGSNHMNPIRSLQIGLMPWQFLRKVISPIQQLTVQFHWPVFAGR